MLLKNIKKKEMYKYTKGVYNGFCNNNDNLYFSISSYSFENNL